SHGPQVELVADGRRFVAVGQLYGLRGHNSYTPLRNVGDKSQEENRRGPAAQGHGPRQPTGRLDELGQCQAAGVTDGRTAGLVGVELQHVRLATHVHGGRLQAVVLADELRVSEHVKLVVADDVLLDRDDPAATHEVLQGPALPHDVLREVATHFRAAELAHILDGDVVQQHGVDFEVTGRAGHDLEHVPEALAGDAARQLLVLHRARLV